MNPTTFSKVAQGKYYWELVFHYDNRNNTGTITDSTKITRKKTVNSKEFLSEKFDVNTGFTYNNKSSVSLKFDGVGEASNETDFSFHLDLARELVETSETAQTIDEESEFERTYQVGPGGQLSLFRLCYISDGVLQKTETVSTEPLEDILIDLKFTCVKNILGLSDILTLFGNTRPTRENMREWETIRNSIVQYSDRSEEEAFRHFVETLKTIDPDRENEREWAAIRTTCSEILNDWGARDKQLLFKKLLTRFSATDPDRENEEEWKKIRELSGQILAGLQPIF